MTRSQTGPKESSSQRLRPKFKLRGPAPAAEILSRIALLSRELYAHLRAAEARLGPVQLSQIEIYETDESRHAQESLL